MTTRMSIVLSFLGLLFISSSAQELSTTSQKKNLRSNNIKDKQCDELYMQIMIRQEENDKICYHLDGDCGYELCTDTHVQNRCPDMCAQFPPTCSDGLYTKILEARRQNNGNNSCDNLDGDCGYELCARPIIQSICPDVCATQFPPTREACENVPDTFVVELVQPTDYTQGISFEMECDDLPLAFDKDKLCEYELVSKNCPMDCLVSCDSIVPANLDKEQSLATVSVVPNKEQESIEPETVANTPKTALKPHHVAAIWIGAIAIAVFLYVILAVICTRKGSKIASSTLEK